MRAGLGTLLAISALASAGCGDDAVRSACATSPHAEDASRAAFDDPGRESVVGGDRVAAVTTDREGIRARPLTTAEAEASGVPAGSSAQKIMWLLRDDFGRGHRVVISATGEPEGTAWTDAVVGGTVKEQFVARYDPEAPAQAGWISQPSLAIFSRPGCYRFTVTNGSEDAEVMLVVRAG